jgi:hypothetical protein
LEVTPVEDFESYLLKVDRRRGLDIEFSDDMGI